MKLFPVPALLLLFNAAPAQAVFNGLQSPSVAAAMGACKAILRSCEFRYEVHRELTKGELCVAGRSVNSCHIVDKALDVFGSDACLESLATCLSASPTPTQYCFKSRGIIGRLAGCDAGAHQDHVHIQPLFGCPVSTRWARWKAGISCD